MDIPTAARLPRRIHLPFLALLGTVLASCSEGPEPTLQGGPTPPAADGALSLELLTRVDGSSIPFGNVGGLTADRAGRMYVADVQARQIVVLDEAGRHVATIGRQGNGPGEFTGLVGDLVWEGDALVAADAQQRRITLFGPEGAVLETRSIPQLADPLPADLVGVFARAGATNVAGLFPGDGGVHLLVHVFQARPVTGGSFMDAAPAAPAPQAFYVRLEGEGSAVTLPLPDTVPWPRGADCAPRNLSRIYPLQLPLQLRRGPPRAFLPTGEAVLAHGDAYRIDVVDPRSGVVLRSITRDLEPRPLLDVDWEAFAEIQELRAYERQAGGPLVARGGVPCPIDDMRPATFPMIRALVADDAGRLWVEASSGAGTLLAVHAPDGRLLGETSMPERDERVAPFARDGRLYLVTVDDLGVQSVEVYRVRGADLALEEAAVTAPRS